MFVTKCYEYSAKFVVHLWAILSEIDKIVVVLSVYWPTLLVESNGQSWMRMLVGH